MTANPYSLYEPNSHALTFLYLLSFDPKSIKVSKECTEEVNRLRKLFKSDILCVELSGVPKEPDSEPKLTGLTYGNIPPQPNIPPKKLVNEKKLERPAKLCTPSSSTVDLTKGNGRVPRAEIQTTWP